MDNTAKTADEKNFPSDYSAIAERWSVALANLKKAFENYANAINGRK